MTCGLSPVGLIGVDPPVVGVGGHVGEGLVKIEGASSLQVLLQPTSRLFDWLAQPY